MIFTALILFVGLLFQGLATILPDTALSTDIVSALNSVGYAINAFSYILPVSAIFNALLIVIGYEGIMWLYHATLWIWKKLPFIGK